MTSLELFFLGALEIRSEGHQLPNPPTLKSQSLLAYLVCHRNQPQARDRLAGLFYGERPERKAHRSLSTALWHIRRCLPEASVLLNDSQTVQFDPQTKFWLDLEAFEMHASRADLAGLQTAAALTGRTSWTASTTTGSLTNAIAWKLCLSRCWPA